MTVRLSELPFDPAVALAEKEASLEAGSYGATASFVGTMRDLNEGDAVTGMTLEHYPGMTEKSLIAIVNEAHERWDLLDAIIVHRVGDISPGEPIVLTAVWSKHRAAAFDACRFLMEALKSRAPFWKKESLVGGGHRWVESNTPGYASSGVAQPSAEDQLADAEGQLSGEQVTPGSKPRPGD